MDLRSWGPRIGLAVGAFCALAILAFYLSRLLMPLPLFAADEGAYLLRALYPDEIMARDPYVAVASNSTHLSLLRISFSLGAMIIGDRIANLAIYLGGLILFWRFAVKGLPRAPAWGLLLLAIGFSYYRFVISNLAEGLFVGLLAFMALTVGTWGRTRPWAHAAAAGALGAMLVLAKANGVAVMAALAAVMALDAVITHDLKRLPVRLAVLAVAFFGLGNLIQALAGEPPDHLLTFFVSRNYSAAISAAPIPGAVGLGVQALAAMAAASAVLMGTPLVAGGADLLQRWRQRTPGWRLEGRDLALLFLAGSLVITLAMVAIYAMKVANTPSETHRLWGRYFEFFTPLIWLAAAPAMGEPLKRSVGWTCVAVTVVGLAGLVVSVNSGMALFPWDCSVLEAFLKPDRLHGPGLPGLYTQRLAGAVCLAATLALCLRLRPVWAGLAIVLTVSGLSTWFDHIWLTPMAAERTAEARDLEKIAAALPAQGQVLLISPDANAAPLAFLKLEGRPQVVQAPPAEAPPQVLLGVDAAVVSGTDPPPGGPWVATYKGRTLSLWRKAPAS